MIINNSNLRSYIITSEEIKKLNNLINKLKLLWGKSLLLNKEKDYYKQLSIFNKISITEEDDSTVKGEVIIEDQNSLTSITRRTTRLFLLVYILTNLYENIGLGLIKKKNLRNIVKDTLSKSALRLSAFITAYSTLYRFLNYQLSLRLPSLLLSSSSSTPSNGIKRMHKHISRIITSPLLAPFLAGSLSSLTMLLESSGSRRVSISISALTRAIQSTLEATSTTRYLPGYLLFALSNSILLHSFVFDPKEFPAGYGNFILRYSKAYIPELSSDYPPTTPFPTSREIVDAIASSSKSRYPKFISPLLHTDSYKTFQPDEIVKKVLPILEWTHPNHTNLTCAFLHPNEVSCWNVFEKFVKDEFKGAAKFFGVITLLTSLIRYKKLLKGPDSPFEIIIKALYSIMTSSAFLSLSIGTAWGTICAFQKYLPSSFLPTDRFYLQGFLAGLWVMLVPTSRASDLGWFSVRTALPTFWAVAMKNKKGVVRKFKVRNGEVIYFGFSMGILMMLWENNPKAISSGFVRMMLKVIAGESKRNEAEMKKVKAVEDEE